MIINCGNVREIFGICEWGPLTALQGPQNRFTQGLIDTPKSLISYRFQISETHVFISIDMVYCIIGGLCLPKFLRTNLFAFLCVCFRISVPTRRKQTDKVHSRCLHHTGRYIRRNSQHLACSDCLQSAPDIEANKSVHVLPGLATWTCMQSF